MAKNGRLKIAALRPTIQNSMRAHTSIDFITWAPTRQNRLQTKTQQELCMQKRVASSTKRFWHSLTTRVTLCFALWNGDQIEQYITKWNIMKLLTPIHKCFAVAPNIVPDKAADAQGVWHEPAQASERPSRALCIFTFLPSLKLPAQPLPAPYKASVRASSSL